MIRTILLALCVAGHVSLAFGQLRDSLLKSLDAYVEQARLDWKVPGLALAVVKDGNVVLSKGYGLRNLESTSPVTAQTLFAMASTTKAMTAAGLAMLVDEGKVAWDDPVVKHLPEFRVKDPYVTRDIRVRDMLTHNTGIGNADFLWAGNDLDAAEILARMENAPMSYPLRGGYTYQNIMYLVAGQIIERASGMIWADFIQERILNPLSMRHTFPLGELAAKQENRSTPHDRVDSRITPIQDTDADMIGPAGSGWSCVEDMAKWMNFLLDSARIDGKRLISRENFSELFTPQIVIPRKQFYSTALMTDPFWTTYAFGWFQHDYRGMTLSFHTGSLAGTVAICALLPEENLGVYVFGNLDHAEVRHALMYKVIDIFTGKQDGRDWSAEFLEKNRESEAAAEKRKNKMIAERKANTRPTLDLAGYTGAYEHPFYGDVKVSLEDGHLIARLAPGVIARLDHWQYDTFQGNYTKAWYSPDLFTFQLNAAGEVEAISQGNTRWTKSGK